MPDIIGTIQGRIDEPLDDAFFSFFDKRPLSDEFDSRPARAAWKLLMDQKIEKDSPIDDFFVALGSSGAEACRNQLAERLNCDRLDIRELEDEEGEHFVEAAKKMIGLLQKAIEETRQS